MKSLFEKKYRVVSYDTGPGTDFIYRSQWVAAYWAMFYEWTERMAGVKTKGWFVQQKANTKRGIL